MRLLPSGSFSADVVGDDGPVHVLACSILQLLLVHACCVIFVRFSLFVEHPEVAEA